MSNAATITNSPASETVVRLPTAQAKRVRQPYGYFLHARSAIERGEVERLPVVQRSTREYMAELEQRREVYRQGGLHQSADLLISMAILKSLSPKQIARLDKTVRALEGLDTPEAKAAAAWISRTTGAGQ